MKRLIIITLATWISVSGCSTSSPLKKMSQDSKSTAELMKQGVPMSSWDAKQTPNRKMADFNYNAYTRDVMTETNMLFPKLPNPTLVMYVFPHMAASGVPVPGYSTAFKLYDSPQYALPGER
ncbi:TIGR03751 family conjugal transfer lipoprotein [Thiomicrorhabdus indica]|uniref:TIGR03751 family conjugal transfer lipoprotein n=1 Tax=Thiomicrorhabdus indica TaxID=2267253 RepID=UPI00102D84C6|nr:TIGR03751 family conjugal transfer lipoprotein [Thiomicrorhabdus indica]